MRSAVILQKKDKSSCILVKKPSKFNAYWLLCVENACLFLYMKVLKWM